jgi:pimeloyl-ACP methyl ester carboxylesterase
MRLWPEPWQEFDVETSFGTAHVHRFGPVTGEPIVLLHGAGANASMWYAQVAALGTHPVYAVDTIDDPGKSVQRVAITGSEDNAAWVDDVLVGLGLDRVHLVGLSYGGWLALNQGIYRPERLASIIALDPGGLQKVRLAFYFSMVAGLFALGAPRRLRPWLAHRLANSALVFPRELLAPIRLSALAFKPDRPPARPFTDEELRSIRVPSLVLLAQRSVLLHAPTALARVERLIPGVQTEIVPGADHGLPLEYPELVNARILRFIEAEAQSPRVP